MTEHFGAASGGTDSPMVRGASVNFAAGGERPAGAGQGRGLGVGEEWELCGEVSAFF